MLYRIVIDMSQKYYCATFYLYLLSNAKVCCQVCSSQICVFNVGFILCLFFLFICDFVRKTTTFTMTTLLRHFLLSAELGIGPLPCLGRIDCFNRFFRYKLVQKSVVILRTRLYFIYYIVKIVKIYLCIILLRYII